MEEAQTFPRSLPREVDEAVTRSRGGENRAMSDTYELRVQGHLDDHWSEWLGELAVQRQADGTTVLVGPVVDQGALHGASSRIRDPGVPLLPVRRPAQDINEGGDDARDREWQCHRSGGRRQGHGEGEHDARE